MILIQPVRKSATVIAMTISGLVMVTLFGLNEVYAKILYPILPSALFTSGRSYVMVCAATTIQ
jgi:hypothetical protein